MNNDAFVAPAAVLAKTLADVWGGVPHVLDVAADLLDALTAAGYAVVAVPEGVTVAHGARLQPIEHTGCDCGCGFLGSFDVLVEP